jgi:hypothetical protein
MLTEFTSYNEIRAALGVSEEEITDCDLESPTRLTLLEEALFDLSPNLLPAWQSLPDVADRSPAQSRFAKLLSLYATYVVASHLLVSVELFGYQKVADGRASTERSNKAFENLRANILGMVSRLGKKLLAALAEVDPGTLLEPAGDLDYIAATGLASDPVSG